MTAQLSLTTGALSHGRSTLLRVGEIDWGDAPTWLGAVFAALAAAAAALTLKSQRDQIAEQREFIRQQSENLALERAELQAAAEERRREQAKKVLLKCRVSGSSGVDRYGNSTGYSFWVAEVHNNSDDPLHDVLVRFGSSYNAAKAFERDADGHPDAGRRTVPVYLVGPRRVVVFNSSQWSEATVDNNPPHVYFTDDAGVRWHLDQYGKLEEVEEDQSGE